MTFNVCTANRLFRQVDNIVEVPNAVDYKFGKMFPETALT